MALPHATHSSRCRARGAEVSPVGLPEFGVQSWLATCCETGANDRANCGGGIFFRSVLFFETGGSTPVYSCAGDCAGVLGCRVTWMGVDPRADFVGVGVSFFEKFCSLETDGLQTSIGLNASFIAQSQPSTQQAQCAGAAAGGGNF